VYVCQGIPVYRLLQFLTYHSDKVKCNVLLHSCQKITEVLSILKHVFKYNTYILKYGTQSVMHYVSHTGNEVKPRLNDFKYCYICSQIYLIKYVSSSIYHISDTDSTALFVYNSQGSQAVSEWLHSTGVICCLTAGGLLAISYKTANAVLCAVHVQQQSGKLCTDATTQSVLQCNTTYC